MSSGCQCSNQECITAKQAPDPSPKICQLNVLRKQMYVQRVIDRDPFNPIQSVRPQCGATFVFYELFITKNFFQ